MLLILALSLVPAEMVPNISFFIVSCIEAGLKVDLSPLFGDRGKLKQAKTMRFQQLISAYLATTLLRAIMTATAKPI